MTTWICKECSSDNPCYFVDIVNIKPRDCPRGWDEEDCEWRKLRLKEQKNFNKMLKLKEKKP